MCSNLVIIDYIQLCIGKLSTEFVYLNKIIRANGNFSNIPIWLLLDMKPRATTMCLHPVLSVELLCGRWMAVAKTSPTFLILTPPHHIVPNLPIPFNICPLLIHIITCLPGTPPLSILSPYTLSKVFMYSSYMYKPSQRAIFPPFNNTMHYLCCNIHII